jgi:hypothetical protein
MGRSLTGLQAAGWNIRSHSRARKRDSENHQSE